MVNYTSACLPHFFSALDRQLWKSFKKKLPYSHWSVIMRHTNTRQELTVYPSFPRKKRKKPLSRNKNKANK